MHTTTVNAPAGGRAGTFLSGFGTGVGLLFRGLGIYARNPRLVLLGIIPGLLSGALYLAAFGTLIYFVSDLAELVTPFADDWAASTRDGVRLVAGLAFLGLGGLLGVLTFTAITLFIGDPFYEKISERVEARYGGVPDEIEVPWWRSLRRSLVDSARLIVRSVLFGIPLFVAGFIPIVGQFVVPVVAALVAGWFLAVELVGVPFYRRGLRLPDRRRVLRANRPLALGFGVAVFLCFLIPLGAVLLMPAAVAGGALLARRTLGQPIAGQPIAGQPIAGQPIAGQPIAGQAGVAAASTARPGTAAESTGGE
ncbi:EI24 domain-containing protein [Plantactinospora sp. S1510]|uniref:EI24 domain-containing protein n=1 Tax=Plantactinospora alkalitolerans TaxID=2789879 RepID=A0ABS0H8M5_9ACTN|nr:EI24 domain-containing protein [Plantactinospora alkalitolerans]MBF9134641.1 EI24 domain-containing protein [Plantactinospora alkalitolerans]